jgi:large subunit ribosomal protein L18e
LYERLQSPRRQRVTVNIIDLIKHYQKGRILVVPGKVLADGAIDAKLQVAALEFSSNARLKIETSGGKCLSLAELMEVNPTGKNVLMIG